MKLIRFYLLLIVSVCCVSLSSNTPIFAQGIFSPATPPSPSLSTMTNPSAINSAVTGLQKQGTSPTTALACASAPTAAASLEIHVLGEVARPGTFWILPGTRVDEAIECAGSISKVGSNREISLRHGNNKKNEQTVDLYSYRIKGDLSQNPYLSNQDVIYVPLYKNQVRISGSIKKPATYEILPSEATLQELINLAGGLLLLADQQHLITLLRPRINAAEAKTAVGYDESHFSLSDVKEGKGTLSNGDIVVVNDAKNRNMKFDFSTLEVPGENQDYPTAFDKVFVAGAVNTPGVYPFKSFYSIVDYAHEAGVSRLSNLKKSKLLQRDGTPRLKGENISPGDVIYIPPKHFTFENGLQLFNVTTQTFFTGFSIYRLFDN